MVEQYARQTGFDVEAISWYEAFGCWKTAIVVAQLYNRYLQGQDGQEQVQVNAFGQASGTAGQPIKPIPGANLRLSLDVNLQRAGEQALQTAVSTIPGAYGGAFVALNPANGEVYAMGSNPSFDPNVFTHPITQRHYDAKFGPSSNYPLLNRAIQTAGPTGSTFKPITATAALQSGAWTTTDVFDDTGQFCFSGQCRHNASMATYGVLDIEQAIKVSSDDFFYNLGVLTNNPAPRGGALQKWARLYGIGQPTGIDVGGEVAGNLPDAAWRDHVNHLEYECDHALGPFKGKAKHAPGGCGIADGIQKIRREDEAHAGGALQHDRRSTPPGQRSRKTFKRSVLAQSGHASLRFTPWAARRRRRIAFWQGPSVEVSGAPIGGEAVLASRYKERPQLRPPVSSRGVV